MTQAVANIAAPTCAEANDAWEQICRSVEKHRRILLFIDFSEALAERGSAPGSARQQIAAEMSHVLRRLSAHPAVTLAIVSGGPVSELAERIGLRLIYIGRRPGSREWRIRASDLEFSVPEADRSVEAIQWVVERQGASPEQVICVSADEPHTDACLHLAGAVNVRVTADNVVRNVGAAGAPYWVTKREVSHFLRGVLDVVEGMT